MVHLCHEIDRNPTAVLSFVYDLRSTFKAKRVTILNRETCDERYVIVTPLVSYITRNTLCINSYRLFL